ncbi:hypothetical protein Bca52824_023895 [Brassica carinata]|uniref:Uncharacterized protein n=1 Tax=Brassica carinata TaxID=52824 RepID=A0A8X8AV53_BRACI|nr:hypothetical protein Bca52824_023895 [Brassica carinata]
MGLQRVIKRHSLVNGAVNGSSESNQEAESSEVAEKQESENGLLKDVDDVKRADLLVEEVQEDASDNGISKALKQKVESLETRIEKLEDEVREVAALEISLYSVVPDNSSSGHKLHTHARRVSRLYIHACKHWSEGKQATVARNTVSAFFLGTLCFRLTFWLSNIITLREITSHAFGTEHKPSEKIKRTKQSNDFKLDWYETETFTAALEKVELWIFSRIVESVWWQVFTPHMQSPENDFQFLPIHARDLSFLSGVQCLAEIFDMNTKDSVEEDEKYFSLLNKLSDLLMLPKTCLWNYPLEKRFLFWYLYDSQVCPSISLPLIKRILCNFTPDEFCPDHVSGRAQHRVFLPLCLVHQAIHLISVQKTRIISFGEKTRMVQRESVVGTQVESLGPTNGFDPSRYVTSNLYYPWKLDHTCKIEDRSYMMRMYPEDKVTRDGDAWMRSRKSSGEALRGRIGDDEGYRRSSYDLEVKSG